MHDLSPPYFWGIIQFHLIDIRDMSINWTYMRYHGRNSKSDNQHQKYNFHLFGRNQYKSSAKHPSKIKNPQYLPTILVQKQAIVPFSSNCSYQLTKIKTSQQMENQIELKKIVVKREQRSLMRKFGKKNTLQVGAEFSKQSFGMMSMHLGCSEVTEERKMEPIRKRKEEKVFCDPEIWDHYMVDRPAKYVETPKQNKTYTYSNPTSPTWSLPSPKRKRYLQIYSRLPSPKFKKSFQKI